MSLSHILTLVANRDATTLTDAHVSAARDMVKGGPPSILSPGEAVDIPCPAPGPGMPTLDTIRAVFGPRHIDTLLTRSRGRRKGLLIADMDSTIVANETLDDLAAHAGIGERIAAITRRSMNGEIDFATALRERVGLLAGLPASLLETAWKDVRLNEGARTLVATMRARNARTALVSGGFTFFTGRVAALCGFSEHHANTLDIRDGTLTGTVGEPILGPDAKRAHLHRLAEAGRLKLAATLAVGDGANDLDMLRDAGLGIAFHGKPIVRTAIGNRVDHTTLRTLLFAQGYPVGAFVTGE
ncbi:phosphoserine phosphatase SerB [Gluconacetobacter diazotrophicus PA1 5]|uniref:Phosphoserine phosphatase n=1 Tax=Gluconacetobacter diazotrophicus (strain ATCC 49037 / DSM 5601 / CCUG 37298 / CIP 103539 / LMG 7603 / PAl5) TaxID=272568 RepID=A9GZI2_GLUDA|nr:phosphoserine phosphatase SerB [Gluconacetobacter diazotrophicus]ACI51540.1 phosphoserine phosphatase SerB [Gluconacetobacter diazotrophicus PA1 5]TWA98237.1 phosphoserine phosphatase [Gluconacetobacter diazotrophicus]CAP53963.1 Phosphoserine phosphatase [Gluconacetobacter diazotrophicus PA1 5]